MSAAQRKVTRSDFPVLFQADGTGGEGPENKELVKANQNLAESNKGLVKTEDQMDRMKEPFSVSGDIHAGYFKGRVPANLGGKRAKNPETDADIQAPVRETHRREQAGHLEPFDEASPEERYQRHRVPESSQTAQNTPDHQQQAGRSLRGDENQVRKLGG